MAAGSRADDGNRSPTHVTFQGVRGSTPCCRPDVQRYGGNTSCVVIETEGHDPILCDLGTGLRQWCPAAGGATGPVTLHALVSHLHWDHVQGLPFLPALADPDVTLRVHGPGEDGRGVGDLFHELMSPPYFPIEPESLPATITFHDVGLEPFEVAGARVTARSVPHTGTTVGFRIERAGVSIAYVPDHQEPLGRPDHVHDGVLELADGVDLLIHDAQYTPEEFARRSDWGHSTIGYAIEVARQARVRGLALFHHDPGRSDDELDRLTDEAIEVAASVGVPTTVAALEGLKLTLEGPTP